MTDYASSLIGTANIHKMMMLYEPIQVVTLSSIHKKDDNDRKEKLHQYLKRTRVQFIRLLVLLRWAKKLPDIHKSKDLFTFLQGQIDSMRDSADKLWTIHKFILPGAKYVSQPPFFVESSPRTFTFSGRLCTISLPPRTF